MRVTVYSEDDFVYYNPWFSLTLNRRFSNFLVSSDLTRVIDTRIHEKFARLWREQASSSEAFSSLISNLNSTVQRGVEKIQGESERQIQKIQTETDRQVQKIISENPELEQRVARAIEAKVTEKYEKQVKDLEREITTTKVGFGLGLTLTVVLFFISR